MEENKKYIFTERFISQQNEVLILMIWTFFEKLYKFLVKLYKWIVECSLKPLLQCTMPNKSLFMWFFFIWIHFYPSYFCNIFIQVPLNSKFITVKICKFESKREFAKENKTKTFIHWKNIEKESFYRLKRQKWKLRK